MLARVIDMGTANANPTQILSIGTQIVTLVDTRGADGRPSHSRGTVGVITQSPSDYWHAYRVQFPDGEAASLKRAEVSVLRHFQDEGIAPKQIIDPLADDKLFDHVIFRCVIGSRA